MAYVEVGINHYRVLQAIRQMGYKAEDAIMDIVDNSVTAKAKRILIQLVYDESKNLNTRRSTVCYKIYDDGEGMTHAELVEAFSPGGKPKEYEADSLSKFGMGLKSAGLSLGNKISVVSKSKKDTEINSYYLSEEVIRKNNQWLIVKGEDSDEVKKFNEFLGGNDKSGTLVTISEPRWENLPSISNLSSKLKARLGVVYEYFLSKGLEIKLQILTVDGKIYEDEKIIAIDPTFYNLSKEIVPQEWRCESPVQLIEKNSYKLTSEKKNNGEMAMTLLPMPKHLKTLGNMTDFALFKDQGGVGPHENIGFYIYRNNRLISWGDSLEGIVPRKGEFAGLRGKLNISSDLDDYFNINVKKSDIVLGEDASVQIKTLLTMPLDTANKAYQAAKAFAETGGDYPDKDVNESFRDFDPPAIEDAEIEKDEESKKNVIKNKKTIENESKQHEEKRREEIENEKKRGGKLPPEASTKYEEDDRFKFSAFLADSKLLWDTGSTSSYGSYVTLNTLHNYYTAHLKTALQSQHSRKCLSDILFSLAHAELEIIKKAKDDSDYTYRKSLFKKYRELIADILYARI